MQICIKKWRQNWAGVGFIQFDLCQLRDVEMFPNNNGVSIEYSIKRRKWIMYPRRELKKGEEEATPPVYIGDRICGLTHTVPELHYWSDRSSARLSNMVV